MTVCRRCQSIGPGAKGQAKIRGCYLLLKLSVSAPVVQVRVSWTNAISMGRLRNCMTHCSCAEDSPAQPIAPTAGLSSVSMFPVIAAGPLIGLHGVFAANWSPPLTEYSSTLSPPSATHGRETPLDVPEMLTYREHGAVGRNDAHDSTGGAETVGDGVATCVPVWSIGPDAHEAMSRPRKSRQKVFRHNRERFIESP
jgi:hypothetical protein